eukprot:CAMPEP_0206470306 /NCGR_PEP_ID=MMETSP0324_2-20121206/30851_1 /ASSEMBLY_ACC=CAM_ASM_000836 /TAXON_ID=2866 /ORGANISM="Crypthecodinium cohnii, Strain Seligo" /LENGTH=132 /DNA_ID=CAMNT_0053944339 /DNA_START=83 /DNA_END=479 /DNA_ORIENTATION=-
MIFWGGHDKIPQPIVVLKESFVEAESHLLVHVIPSEKREKLLHPTGVGCQNCQDIVNECKQQKGMEEANKHEKAADQPALTVPQLATLPIQLCNVFMYSPKRGWYTTSDGQRSWSVDLERAQKVLEVGASND